MQLLLRKTIFRIRTKLGTIDILGPGWVVVAVAILLSVVAIVWIKTP